MAQSEYAFWEPEGYKFRRFNSKTRKEFAPDKLKGVVPLSVAIAAIHLFTARAGVVAQGKVYRRKVRELKETIRDSIIGKAATKLLSKEAAKKALSVIASAWDFEKQAQLDLETENAIRAEGLRTMKEVLRLRAFGHKKTKVKTFWSRRGKPAPPPAPVHIEPPEKTFYETLAKVARRAKS